MAEEELDFYKDISDLKRDLEGLKLKKNISNEDLYDAVQKLGQTITDMLEVFAAAAEQMQVEEKSYDAQTKKQDMFSTKLDKLIEQNRTIAEGMVAIVDLVKDKFTSDEKEEKEEPMFNPAPQPIPGPNPFIPRPQPQWQPSPEPMMPRATMSPPSPSSSMTASIPPPPMPEYSMPSIGEEFSMPPMEPEPMPNLDFPDEVPSLEEGAKKKGLFGMFKK